MEYQFSRRSRAGAGTFAPALGAQARAVGAAQQHPGDLEQKLLVEPVVQVDAARWGQGQFKVRVVQVPLPRRPLCLHPGVKADGVEAARAFAMHRCACPQSHPHFVPVCLRGKAGLDGRFDPRTGKIAPRQVAVKRLLPAGAAGCDEPSQVKLHSTPLKSCLVSIAPKAACVKPQIAHRQIFFTIRPLDSALPRIVGGLLPGACSAFGERCSLTGTS